MKKIFIIFLFLPYLLMSQSIIGFVGGATENSIFNQADFGTSYKNSFFVGANIEMKLVKKLFLCCELNYYSKGFNQNIPNWSGNPSEQSNFRYAYSFNYITSPIIFKYSGAARQFGYFGLGLSPSYLISYIKDEPQFNLEGIEDGRRQENLTDQVNRFDLTGVINAGLGFRIDQFQLCLDFRYNPSFIYTQQSYSTTDITGMPIVSSMAIKHKSYSLGLQFRYIIKSCKKHFEDSHKLNHKKTR